MNRTHIPNLIGKYVILEKMEIQILNGKIGLVIGWNEECASFIVQLLYDEAVRLIKPYYLRYYPIFENEAEQTLCELIRSNKLTNFEKGMEFFQQLESIKTYSLTHLQIVWLRYLLNVRAPHDKRYVPKIQNACIHIMKVSEFEDLIVPAKILLSDTLFLIKRQNLNVVDLCFSCLDAHYGKLPKLYTRIVINMGLKFDHELSRRLYLQSKNLILNETCEGGFEVSFIDVSLKFFKYFLHSLEEISEEATFLRTIINKQLKVSSADKGHYLLRARISFLEENYLASICDAEFVTSHTNLEMVINANLLKIECYIRLKNKSMANNVLEKLKKISHVSGIFGDLEQAIENIIQSEN